MQKKDELSLTQAQKPWWPHTALRRGLLQDTGPGRPPTKAVCREGVGSSQNRREGDAEADDRPAEDTPRASSSCRTWGRDPGAGEKPSGCGAAQTRPRRARVQPGGGQLCRRTGTWEGGGAGGATRDVGRHRPTRPGRPAAAQPRRTRCPRLFCVDRSSSFSSRDFAGRVRHSSTEPRNSGPRAPPPDTWLQSSLLSEKRRRRVHEWVRAVSGRGRPPAATNARPLPAAQATNRGGASEVADAHGPGARPPRVAPRPLSGVKGHGARPGQARAEARRGSAAAGATLRPPRGRSPRSTALCPPESAAHGRPAVLARSHAPSAACRVLSVRDSRASETTTRGAVAFPHEGAERGHRRGGLGLLPWAPQGLPVPLPLRCPRLVPVHFRQCDQVARPRAVGMVVPSQGAQGPGGRGDLGLQRPPGPEGQARAAARRWVPGAVSCPGRL